MSVYIWAAKMADYTAMQGPCPTGFHVPTASEFQWVEDIMTWLSLTSADDYRFKLHLPLAGRVRQDTAAHILIGSYWWYRTSTPRSEGDSYTYYTRLNWSYWVSSGARNNWYSVRAFKNEYVEPTSSWTVEQWTLWGAWLFWNQTDWLISITDWTVWYTIMDKNLWATEVLTQSGYETANNCGSMFQRWNNYWFSYTSSEITTSSTQVNASNYWPWNYYNSSSFIAWSFTDWSSVRNDNLWWWNSTIPKELKSAYIGDWPNAWIYHNASLWLITFKKWAYKYTFADKNLWATSTDVTSSASYWYYFQFWNNHWRTSRPSSRSASQIDWSSYWPWNYYNSSTFHTVSDWNNPTLWDNSWNLNLWWDTTNTYEARQWPCPSWWHIPSWTEVYDIFWEIWNRHNIKTKEWFRQCLLMPQPWWLAYNDWTVIDVWDVWVWMTTQRWWISWSHIWRFHSAWWDWTAGSAGYWWRTNCWNTAQIRPFKNGYVEPDETWTLLLDMS